MAKCKMQKAMFKVSQKVENKEKTNAQKKTRWLRYVRLFKMCSRYVWCNNKNDHHHYCDQYNNHNNESTHPPSRPQIKPEQHWDGGVERVQTKRGRTDLEINFHLFYIWEKIFCTFSYIELDTREHLAFIKNIQLNDCFEKVWKKIM